MIRDWRKVRWLAESRAVGFVRNVVIKLTASSYNEGAESSITDALSDISSTIGRSPRPVGDAFLFLFRPLLPPLPVLFPLTKVAAESGRSGRGKGAGLAQFTGLFLGLEELFTESLDRFEMMSEVSGVMDRSGVKLRSARLRRT